MKCAVITPIGPGHEESYNSLARKSIEFAIKTSKGEFTEIIIIPMPDLQGVHGRSERRNSGVRHAKNIGCEWIFFLDADDYISAFAFEDVSKHLNSYDAIWGNICSAPSNDIKSIVPRPNQLLQTNSVLDILRYDPFLTLQMGHFVKTDLVLQNPFDENMDVGEDFKYYLSIWGKYKCAKVLDVFFVNLRGNHSSGPRSADGAAWREAVTHEIAKFKYENFNQQKLETIKEQRNAVIVAHPDDEALFAGGLLSRYKEFDVICCSIPFKDPERAFCYFESVRLLGHHPILFPYQESNAQEPLMHLEKINLSNYDNIFTHNSEGEYGHPHHIQISNFVKDNFEGEIYHFGYGTGNICLELTDQEQHKKFAAIKCYNNKPENFHGLETWKVLLSTLKVDQNFEFFRSKHSAF